MLKDKLQADLKKAMLSRDTETVDVLKGLKSAILYTEVAEKKRENGLSDEEILAVFKKESKKRQDSADMYAQAGDETRSAKERAEKAIIDSYLPKQLSEEAVLEHIEKTIQKLSIENPQKQDMGRIIGAVKAELGAEVDGSILAQLVQKRIQST